MSPTIPKARHGLLALLATLGALAIAPNGRAASPSPTALPVQVTFNANPAQPASAVDETWTVPTGVTQATFYAAGGAGGAGTGGAVGGGGGNVEATFTVVPGETFDVVVGGNGASGSPAALAVTGVGGIGGAPSGGRGGDGETAPPSLPALGGGGGGGGQSSVTLATGGEATLELVAPGGGGGGAAAGSEGGGAGGAGAVAGSADEQGDATGGGAGGATTAGAGGTGPTSGTSGGENRGADATDGSGAGGGGDGFFGGGSGAGGAEGGAGGGGGGFYLSTAALTSERLSPSTVGSVAIGYTPPPAPPPPPPPQPRVSIIGTPALAEPLTCAVTDVPAGATVTVTWLRDGEPVAGASGTGYTIAAGDEGNYLQCSATVSGPTGTGSATSAFVAVPVQGLQAAVATTSLSRTRVRGAAVSVLARCSPRAALHCVIALALSIVETVRGGRLAAVSATAHGPRPASARRRTVTVGARTFTLAPGAQRTLAVALTPAGLRLLAREKRLPVRLLATGTLVGALSATLLDESLALNAGRRR